MTRVISSTKARENFSEIINQVAYQGANYIISKQGKAVACITQIKKAENKENVTLSDEKDFLLKLASYNLKMGPKDLAKNHDKYTWE